ncbi:Hamartin protein-domain-containing protein [Phascolomyces articulosus]|uniref:Hamartin protein-domain-containing protein n=1 Tax=Phascolomyces articulosus TaxID=60185 RepID=A0AAD5K456_9FUNG|nr:Hamartin protein-domain-containing protein [Phascolomyces articulosus]
MLKSMMYDNSTTLIAMSVTNLIMLLPRMCTSLPPHLPQLFYIFARALCWDQLRDIRQKQNIAIQDDQPSDSGSSPPLSFTGNSRVAADGWDCADYTFSKLSAPPSNPLTGPFFTSLYGLYPCNFVRFLHAPYAYFVEKEFHMPEEFDEETFRSRTLTQVSRHMLHPSLVTMDTETELTDRSRWMKMEPPDVIAQIMSLDLTNAASRVAFSSDKQHRGGSQPDLLDEAIWAHTGQVPCSSSSPSENQNQHLESQQLQQQQQKYTPSTITDSITNVHEKKQQSNKAVNSILDMHRALKGGAEVLIGDDVWDADLERLSSPSPSASVSPLLPDPVSISTTSIADTSHLSETISSPTSSTVTMSPETKLLIAALKREVLLLRNELNFELFVKQQHLQHMGRLHREHVVDSSVEAERQRTYNTTRILRAQLKEAITTLTKLKAESALTTQKHIKWEDEQGSKLRSYREARRKWQGDMEEARQKIQEQEKCAAEQHAKLLRTEQRVFELENELKTRQPLLEKAAENEHRVMQLTKQMLLWAHLEEQKGHIKGLLSQWWGMEELIASLQAENQYLTKRQSELDDEKEKISLQLEEHLKKVPLPKSEVSDLDKAEKDSHKKQMKQMKIIVDELKERIEALEVEKIEWHAQVEQAVGSPPKKS